MEPRPAPIATDSARRAQAEVVKLGYSDMTAGATRSLGPILPACWSFQVLTLAPLMLRLLLGASIVEKIMGVLIVLYMAFLVAMARSYHRSLSRSLRLGFEYESLVRDLGDE